MSDRAALDEVIDSLEFAREGCRLEGDAPVSTFRRLADVLADEAGSLRWELSGEIGRDGKPYLLLRLRGSMNLRCQRCLEAVVFALDRESRLLLMPPGEAWPDDELTDDRADAIEADRELALLSLVEDEVLLALPMAPRHDECRTPAPAHDEREPSPFSALAKLKT